MTAEECVVPLVSSPERVRDAVVRNTSRFRLWRHALVSGLLLVPCFWQSRIQAGDLSSHLYNAWLAQLIREGRIAGLELVPQWTNALFDLMLRTLARFFSYPTTERIAVAAAVLIFFWGAFTFVCAASRRRPWFLAPCLAVLSYGWVFHMGFFNFYMGLGLSFWGLALFWRAHGLLRFAAVPVMALAIYAHALPAAWAVGAGAYIWLAIRIRPRRRFVLAAGCLGSIGAVTLLLSARLPSFWSIEQNGHLTGADQAWIGGVSYFPAVAGVLAFWGVLFARALAARGWQRFVLGTPFQLCLLSAGVSFLIPTAVLLPGFQGALSFVSPRMSLATGVLICSALAAARPGKFELALVPVAPLLFFVPMFIDAHGLNRLEDRVTIAAAQLPPGASVISSLRQSGSRVDQLLHMVDRACIGRCFSYANYEASTGQFAIRARRGNRIVFSERTDVLAVEGGNYIVRASDVPVYEVGTEGDDIRAHKLQPGDRVEIRATVRLQDHSSRGASVVESSSNLN